MDSPLIWSWYLSLGSFSAPLVDRPLHMKFSPAERDRQTSDLDRGTGAKGEPDAPLVGKAVDPNAAKRCLLEMVLDGQHIVLCASPSLARAAVCTKTIVLLAAAAQPCQEDLASP